MEGIGSVSGVRDTYAYLPTTRDFQNYSYKRKAIRVRSGQFSVDSENR